MVPQELLNPAARSGNHDPDERQRTKEERPMFELMDTCNQNAVIKVVGVGGGGGNAVQHMVNANIEGVEFICANTDAQALKNCLTRNILQLGSTVTKGLGAGANPETGRRAALEDRDRIADMLEGADMVFVTAGMGGGTGTGAAPVVAQVAKEMGILTVAVVTRPFSFEGRKRGDIAAEGIKELSQFCDSLITIPNEKLLTVLGKGISLLEAFKSANNVLLGAVQGIAELITRPGLINVDFADVRTVMSEMGMAMMGTGVGTGTDRAHIAAEAAISSPLLEDVNLAGARGILVNITSGLDITMGEFEEVGNTVKKFASDTATVVVGTVIDQDLVDEIRVTVVATGLGRDAKREEQAQVRLVQPQPVQVQPTPAVANSDVGFEPPVNPRTRGGSERMEDMPRREPAAVMPGSPEYLDIPAFLRRQAD
jgi:cell division protein FtsZ